MKQKKMLRNKTKIDNNKSMTKQTTKRKRNKSKVPKTVDCDANALIGQFSKLLRATCSHGKRVKKQAMQQPL